MPNILTDAATFSEVYALLLAMAYQRKKGKRQIIPSLPQGDMAALLSASSATHRTCPSRIRSVE